MLGAADALAHAGFRVNARGCRPIWDGLSILAKRKRFPPAVILGLGANADVARADIGRALRIIGKRSTLVLVTPGNGGADPQLMRRAARRRKRVCVADWARKVRRHPSYAPGDGLHLSFAGIDAYVEHAQAVPPDHSTPSRRMRSRIRSAAIAAPAGLRWTPSSWRTLTVRPS